MFPPEATAAAAMGLEQCLRVLPHMQDTGGFFIAVFERLGGEEQAQDEEDEVEVSSVARLLATVPPGAPRHLRGGAGGARCRAEAAAEPAPRRRLHSCYRRRPASCALADAEAAAAAAATARAGGGGVYGGANSAVAAQARMLAATPPSSQVRPRFGLRPWWLQECAAWWGLPEAGLRCSRW